MKRRALALVALTGLALAAAGAAGGARRHPPCPPARGKVLARSRSVRVWSEGSRGVPVVACDVRSGSSLTLLPRARRPGLLRVHVDGFAIAGDIVGYIETTSGIDSGSHTLLIADVAARRTLRRVPAGAYSDAGIVFLEDVAALIVTPRGSAAWITSSSRLRAPGPAAVHLAARTGPVLLLDEGSAVEPASLRVEGSVLSWNDGGVRHTHAMP